MAKSTHAQEVATGTSDSYTEHELSDPQPVIITRPMLGDVDQAIITEQYAAPEVKEEMPSPLTTGDGGDFIPSSQSESSESSRQTQSPPQPAPMTENPSSPILEEVSAVDSTDGDGQTTEPQPSDSPPVGRKTPAKKAAAPKKTTGARATMMGAEDEFSEFE